MNYIIGIDHTGIAVPDLEEALPLYQGLGYEIASGPVIDEDRGIRVCFIRQNQFTIELVSPAYADKKSVIDSFLMSKRGYEIYHICYLVSDLEKQIEIMLKNGYLELHKPAVSRPMGGRKAAYLYHRQTGLAELAEPHTALYGLFS